MTHLSRRHITKFLADKFGAKVLDISITKHAHVKFDYHGHECWAVFAVSPSDGMWEQIKFNDIRKDLKQRGIWVGNK